MIFCCLINKTEKNTSKFYFSEILLVFMFFSGFNTWPQFIGIRFNQMQKQQMSFHMKQNFSKTWLFIKSLNLNELSTILFISWISKCLFHTETSTAFNSVFQKLWGVSSLFSFYSTGLICEKSVLNPCACRQDFK